MHKTRNSSKLTEIVTPSEGFIGVSITPTSGTGIFSFVVIIVQSLVSVKFPFDASIDTLYLLKLQKIHIKHILRFL